MKSRNIALITAGSTVALISAAAGICFGLVKDSPEAYIKPSTKTPEIDINSGLASIELEFVEQPSDNVAIISIKTIEANNHEVILADANETGELIVDVVDRKATIRVCFKEYIGNDASSNFDLTISYVNSNGHLITTDSTGYTLELKYNRPEQEELHIYNINDFHGAAPGIGDEYFESTSIKNPGAIRLANQLFPELNKYPGSIFLSSGDNTSGEAFSTSTHAQTMFPLLSKMGIRYCCPGNHAFEWGLDPLAGYDYDTLGRTENTIGNYFVASNILNTPIYQDKEWISDPDQAGFERDYTIWNTQRVNWADPYKLVDMDGHLICLIGLTTNDTLLDGNQAVVKHLSFVDYNASVSYSAKLCYDTLGEDWFNKIESFILLTHVGSAADNETEPGDAEKLAKNLKFDRVDAVIAGHTHKSLATQVENDSSHKKIWVGQANTAGREYLDTKFEFDNTKEVGKRLKNISMAHTKVKIDYGGFDPSSSDPEIVKKAKEAATAEYKQIVQNPSCEEAKTVIDEYYKQRDIVQAKLKEEIAVSKDGLKNDAADSGKHLGHEYYDPYDTTTHKLTAPVDNQSDAWCCLGEMVGFSNYAYEDIMSTTSNVELPAISIINLDSVPKGVKAGNVTLKDMYNLQPYDDVMHFGFLSVWQLANIIDYSLSGYDMFNYTLNSDYVYEDDLKTIRNDTRSNFKAKEIVSSRQQPIKTAQDLPPLVPYKNTQRSCCYLCGVLQWYGFRFEVEEIAQEEQSTKHAHFQLKYHEPTANEWSYGKFTLIPNIWIYKPKAIYDPTGIYEPDEWLSADEWLKLYGENKKLIPVTVDSFVYDGGNVQTTLIQNYMLYNETLDNRLYKHHKYSFTSRDTLTQYCKLSSQQPWSEVLHFDLSKEITNNLMKVVE